MRTIKIGDRLKLNPNTYRDNIFIVKGHGKNGLLKVCSEDKVGNGTFFTISMGEIETIL